ncbi:MAG: universal stress protein [Nitrospiraceae bacterium]|nr:MAG: universal stress protein [Nitrospiraceae bacterium]
MGNAITQKTTGGNTAKKTLPENTIYKTLLVGFDDSQPSKAALIEASNWIRKNGGKLILAHAVYFDTEEFGIAPEQLEKRLKAGEKACVQSKEMVTSEFGIDVQSLLCEGDPPTVIVDVAHEKKADLIVLGTYGRKGLNRLLMGSVTSYVILNSPVDVLVVKKPCTECTGEYNSILVPFDGSVPSQKALNRAVQMARINNAQITAMYVIPRYEEMIGFFRTDSIKKTLWQEAQKILDTAKKLAERDDTSIKLNIEEGHADEVITGKVKSLKTDLIVMGSYGYRGVNKAIIGSTAERVIIHASCPILVVK